MGRLTARFTGFFAVPLLRRAGFHARRLTGGLDASFFTRLAAGLIAILLVAAALVTLAEPPATKSVGGYLGKFGGAFYWGVTTVMGSGDSGYVTEVVGYVVSWILVIFGVAIVASITGALVGFLIDYLIKEGAGMGASGYKDHIVVCGWNATARELIAELQGDEYTTKVVVVHPAEKNPAGSGTYFVNGDITDSEDLARAGVVDAMAVVVCPADSTNEADMKSILCLMAVEALSPGTRTVVEANNPNHVVHFQRAKADEIVVSSRIASRLLARSSLYPGLADIVTDIVSGGEGSELYRVSLPDDYVGLSIDDLSAKLRADHRATLLSVSRDGTSYLNPPEDFRLAHGDDAVVVAESLGTLAPLQMDYDL